MRIFTVCLAIFIAFVHISNIHGTDPPSCPNPDNPNETYFANPDNCSTYYQCDNGVAKLRECGTGTFWNSDTTVSTNHLKLKIKKFKYNNKFQECDWPWNVTCTS